MSPAEEKNRIDREHFDKVARIVIDKFNAAGIQYGKTSATAYPVKWEDVFSEPAPGGVGFKPSHECRGMIAYIIANHVPIWDNLLSKDRLVSLDFIARYMVRNSTSSVWRSIGTGCSLISRPEYSKVYALSLLQMASDGIEVWNTPRKLRVGDCNE